MNYKHRLERQKVVPQDLHSLSRGTRTQTWSAATWHPVFLTAKHTMLFLEWWEKPCQTVKLSLLMCFLPLLLWHLWRDLLGSLTKNCPIFSNCYLKILLVFTVLHICLQWSSFSKTQTIFDFIQVVSVQMLLSLFHIAMYQTGDSDDSSWPSY